MSSRALFYFLKNGDPLSAETLNLRFQDIDRRMVAIEGLEIDYQAAVALVQNMAIERLDAAVRPLVAQVQADTDRLLRIIAEAGQLVTEPELDARLAEPDSLEMRYEDGRVAEVIARLPNERVRTTRLTYTADGNLDTTVTTLDGQTRSVRYLYADGVISGYTVMDEEQA